MFMSWRTGIIVCYTFLALSSQHATSIDLIPTSISEPKIDSALRNESEQQIGAMQITQKTERIFHASGGATIWNQNLYASSLRQSSVLAGGLEIGIRINSFSLTGEYAFDAGRVASEYFRRISTFYNIHALYVLSNGGSLHGTVKRSRFNLLGSHDGALLKSGDASFEYIQDTSTFELYYEMQNGINFGINYERPILPMSINTQLYDSFDKSIGSASYVDRDADIRRLHFTFGYNSLGNIQAYLTDMSKFYVDFHAGIGFFSYTKGAAVSAAVAGFHEKSGGVPISAFGILDIGYIFRSLNGDIPDSGITLRIGYRGLASVMFVYTAKKDSDAGTTTKYSEYGYGRLDLGHGPYISLVKSF
jgi:hypothetical protein